MTREHSNLGSINVDKNDEINLVDILHFLKSSYKIILTSAVIGLAISIVYIGVTPNKYEATAQIFMAQVGMGVGNNNNNNNNNNNKNPLGNDLEEPSLVVARFMSPSSMSPTLMTACGYGESHDNVTAGKVSLINLTIPKGISSVVEARVIAPTPQLAGQCADAFFKQIKEFQANLLMPFIEDAKNLLASDEARLKTAQEILLKADKSGFAMSATYLSTRDEIRYLLDEIAGLRSMLNSSQTRSTRLVSPVYVNPNPVSPKRLLLLGLGLAAGILLGILVAVIRQQWIGTQSANTKISVGEHVR